MSLAAASTQLIRYVEDRRADLREKPPRMSWYQYLQSDPYAKKMLERVVEEACEFLTDKQAVAENAGHLGFVKNAIPFTDRRGFEYVGRDHEVSLACADEKMFEWVRGCVTIDVHLSDKYTAGIRVLFG